jgi:hypothetical protein
MKFNTFVRTAMLCVALAGCTKFCGLSHKDMTPEQVVETYLNVAFNMRDPGEREKLATLTTGKLRQAIDSAPEEIIKAAYVDRRYTIKSYSVIERRDRTPRETEITFRLMYTDLGSATTPVAADAAATVTTDNTVNVVRDKGTWYIRDVVGSKTAIDFPLSADNKIEAKPGVIGPDPDQASPAENTP